MDTPATPQPDSLNPQQTPEPGPPTWSSWFAQNALSIIFSTTAVVLILVYLNVWDTVKVAIGLGLVIFIHELGHFLAAKMCDVHVKMFSIGFGKPVPGCQFSYGETTYKLGWIPLGGFVQMVGEGDNADTEEAEEDPRSFKNKPVGQRMFIISAGVLMNIFLAAICFIIVYSRGVEEVAPLVGWTESGSPAWQEGLESGQIIDELDDLKNPVFNDIKPIVMGSKKDEQVRFLVSRTSDGERWEIKAVPARDGDALFPTVGVGPAAQLTLIKSRRPEIKPYYLGSRAEEAKEFRPADRIIACSVDPANPAKVEPIRKDERPGANGKLDYFEFLQRQYTMRNSLMIIRVERADSKEIVDIPVKPAYQYVLGARMRMGRIAAIKKNSPAATAQVVGGGEIGIRPRKGDDPNTGDKLVEVEVTDFDEKDQPKVRKWSTDSEPFLDPLRLPHELESWADRVRKQPEAKRNWTVKLTVSRPAGGKGPEFGPRVQLETKWADENRFLREIVTTPNSPLAISGLGLAYHVEAVVEKVEAGKAAEAAGLKDGDKITQIRGRAFNPKKNATEPLKWQDVKGTQWAFIFDAMQDMDAKELDLKIERAGESAPVELTVKMEEDPTWANPERGLRFQNDTRLHKGDNIWDALGLGAHRTVRTVKLIYLNLYSMIFGRVSAFTMSGPLTIADVSYKIAGEDIWQFILFIGMINVNLAVINFLPIPVLDGGHMVFLIYEKIRGKPMPESVMIVAMYIGLAMILSLMIFVIFLDVRRLFF